MSHSYNASLSFLVLKVSELGYLGKPLINQFFNNAQPFDQFVFQDKDGQYYIIYGGWGRCNIAKLNESFTSLEKFPDGNLVKDITPKDYVEGPTMFIRNGKYYLMWSEGGWTNGTYKVAYAISDSVFGPFERVATILEADETIATGAGHHSLMNGILFIIDDRSQTLTATTV